VVGEAKKVVTQKTRLSAPEEITPHFSWFYTEKTGQYLDFKHNYIN
jgi:hypothetical protein